MAKVNLSADLETVRGEIGGEIYTKRRSGLIIKAPPQYKFKLTPAMQQTSDTFTQATELYKTMSREQAKAWNAYADGLVRHNDVTGQPYHPTGRNTFLGLTCKFLQINPGASPPLTPPAGSFVGDRITVAAFEDNGLLLFLADGANHAPTRTELLLQKLPSQFRQPTDKFVSVTFFVFSGVSDYYAINVPPGIYVPATRFVNAATGQMTERIALPEVEIA